MPDFTTPLVDVGGPDQTVFEFQLPKMGQEEIEHFRVLLQALHKFSERETSYAGAWKDLGAKNNLARAYTKALRLINTFWKRDDHPAAPNMEQLDDAIDLINYAVFFVRQARVGEWR